MNLLLAAALALAAPAAAALRFWSDSIDAQRSLFEAGKYSEVVAKLSPDRMQRLRGSTLREAYFLLGASHDRLGRVDEALGVFQLGAKLYPQDINLLSELATLLHRMKLEEQAEPLFQRVLKIHPHNARAHLGLAEIDQALGFYDRSAEHYEKALEKFGNQASLWISYGEVLLSLQDHKTAELAARKALSLAATAEASILLARSKRAAGLLDEALEAMAAASAASPERVEIKLTRALWLLEAARFDEAEAVAVAALDADSRDPLALWIRARARLRAGQRRDALLYLRMAAASGRRAPFVARAAERLADELEAMP